MLPYGQRMPKESQCHINSFLCDPCKKQHEAFVASAEPELCLQLTQQDVVIAGCLGRMGSILGLDPSLVLCRWAAFQETYGICVLEQGYKNNMLEAVTRSSDTKESSRRPWVLHLFFGDLLGHSVMAAQLARPNRIWSEVFPTCGEFGQTPGHTSAGKMPPVHSFSTQTHLRVRERIGPRDTIGYLKTGELKTGRVKPPPKTSNTRLTSSLENPPPSKPWGSAMFSPQKSMNIIKNRQTSQKP